MFSFDLSAIATRLESLEETIIFRLIDRVQLGRNLAVYEPNRFPLSGTESTLLNHMLRFHESTHAMLGRYVVAEERPFFSDLPIPAEGMAGDRDVGLQICDFNQINLTASIRLAYTELLDRITVGNDGEYGTTAETDIASLQAIARRIHFGSFYVAEAKFRGNPDHYTELIRAKDEQALMRLLTRQEVEDRIIIRIREKCASIQAISNPLIRKQIDPDQVAQFYFATIIPLTKVGEITYLLNRTLP